MRFGCDVMALLDIELLIMLVVTVFEIYFIVAPVRNMGWLNLGVGVSGLVSTLFIMSSYVTSSFLAWFGLIPVFCCIGCILRADGITKLP